MKPLPDILHNLIRKPSDAAPLAVFRILFGAAMLFSTLRFLLLGWVHDHYITPRFHFKYFGFSWVEQLPEWGLYAVHGLMLLAALGILLGAFYRLSALLFFLCFSYTELLDLTYYLNHYYFVSLASLLLILVPANAYCSLDNRWFPHTRANRVPAWTINIFRFQLGLVYLYAGLAKINTDWLIYALPLKIWLPAGDELPLLGWLFSWEYSPYLFSWCGMLYDCLIPFLLLWRPSRPWAYLTVIFFHAVTGLLFQIGVFPLVMILSTLIFFSNGFQHRLLALWHALVGLRYYPEPIYREWTMPKWQQPLLILFFSLYIPFQILFPWRYLLYPGDLFWTEEGYRFSWRVMLMEKAGTATFYVKDGSQGREGVVINQEFLNPHQEKQMAMQPDMILQYAHFLAGYYRGTGMKEPQIRAEVYVTLNGRAGKLLIDPQRNLVPLQDSWTPKDWILHYPTR